MGVNWSGFSRETVRVVQDKILKAAEKEHNKSCGRFKNDKGQEVQQITFTTEEFEAQPGNFLNIIKCTPAKITNPTPIFYLHGYAACGAYFANSMMTLSSELGRECIAIDWPGMGCSNRNLKYNPKNTKVALKYFLDPLEQYRIKNNIEKLDVIAHSFGGYFASKYALKVLKSEKKKIIDKLILASPIGIVHLPIKDFPLDQFLESWRTRAIFGTIYKMHITANTAIRSLGSNSLSKKGYNWVDSVIERRFAGNKTMGIKGISAEDDETKDLVVQLSHQIFATPNHSQKAIYDLMQPTLHAYDSFESEFLELSEQEKKLLPDITIAYGERADWVGWKDKEVVNNFVNREKEKDDKFPVKVVDVIGTHHFVITHNEYFDRAVLMKELS